jgi:hypothetical protein
MLLLKPITPASANSYREVRLCALQDTPSAFGSTYAKESQLSDDDWAKRAIDWNSGLAVAYLAWDGDIKQRCRSPFLSATGIYEDRRDRAVSK